MQAQTPLGSPINFDKYIEEKALGFTGRQWVFEELDAWLQDDNAQRVFLLTGEPGAGKSAIAARLARISSGAVAPPAGLRQIGAQFLCGYHFCNARELRWINPLTFSHSLALQLSARFPDFAEALIETSDQGRTSIRGTVNVAGNTTGQVVGTWINTLKISSMPSQKAFGLLVREPLEKFLQAHAGQRIVLLVDALDESLIFNGDDTILTLIALTEELESVRFILTSRHDSRVETQFMAAKKIYLSEDKYAQQNRNDIGAFVRARLPADTATREVVDQIAGKAGGNFQYVSFLINAIAKKQLSLSDMRGLPAGLDDLYHLSIERVVKIGKKRWATAYAPILGTLSVARQSLTVRELQNFTGQKESQISGNLNDLDQFVREIPAADAQGDSTYRIFHQSFGDMLRTKGISGGANKNLYYLPPSEQHQRIVEYYRQGRSCAAIPWSELDDYGLLHLPSHANELATTATYKTALYDMISSPLLWARWSRYRSHGPFADDVRLLMCGANSATPPDIAVRVRGALILATLASMAGQTPPEAIRALALAGCYPQAHGHASLIPEMEPRQRALLMVHEAMPRGEQNTRDLFREASAGLLPSNLAAAAPALAEYQEMDRIPSVLALTSRDVRPRLELDIVESLCTSKRCDEALAFMDSIEDQGDRVRAMCRVLVSLPPASPERNALAARCLASARSMVDAEAKASALSYVGDGLRRSGSDEMAKQVAIEGLDALDTIAPRWALMPTICRFALALANVGELARACASALRIADQEAARIAREPSLEDEMASPPESGPQSLVARTDAMAAKVMAHRLTGINIISQVPELGRIVIQGGLLDNDIRANAINWIAQTLAAEREQPRGKEIASQLQAALDQIPAGEAGLKELALSYVSLILAEAGEGTSAKTLIDSILQTLGERPVTRSVYREQLIAIGPALALAGDVKQAVSLTKPLKDPKNENSRDEIWTAICGRLTIASDTENVIAVLGLVGNADTKAKAIVNTVQTLGDSKNYRAADVLGVIGEIDNSLANALPPAPRLRVLAAVASRFAEIGAFGRAVSLALRVIETAEAPGDSATKARALASIADALVGTGVASKATEVAGEALENAGQNAESILAIADAVHALACCAQFDRALTGLETIGDKWKNKSYARRDVALMMARGGNADRSVEIAGLIKNRAVQAEAFTGIAEILLEGQMADRAATLATMALDLLNASGNTKNGFDEPTSVQMTLGEPSEMRPVAWKGLQVLSKAGKQESATTMVQAMEGRTDPVADLLYAVDTALGLFVCGSKDHALELAERSLTQVPLLAQSDFTVVIPWGWAAALHVLARQFERAVEIARAILTTEKVSNDTLNVMNEGARVNAVLELARVCEREGEIDWSAKLLELTLAHLRSSSYTFVGTRCKGQIVVAYARLGLLGPASSLWQELLAASQSSGRLEVFDAVRYGAPLLARLDNGQTLWRAYQSMRDVESWWKMPDSPSAALN